MSRADDLNFSMSQEKKTTPVSNELAFRTLLRPRMTEKAHLLLSVGRYVFQISPSATKRQVKLSVEAVYGVSVDRVNIVRIPKKRRVFGRTVGWKSSVKKAIVTLKKGESIELFKGV